MTEPDGKPVLHAPSTPQIGGRTDRPPVVPYATPLGARTSGFSAEELYANVPWFRQSEFNSLMVFLGLCLGFPLVVVSVIVLTGQVYYPTLGRNGRLKQWGAANKVAAV